ncbi:unnamed protein product [Caenorhabditis brenneri]
MSDPEKQASPEFLEAFRKYLDRQDPGVGLVFLFFCSIYIAAFISNMVVFKRLFGYRLAEKPMKTHQPSIYADFFDVINACIIIVLLLCLGCIIFFLIKNGVIGRRWLALWSIFLLMFIRLPIEYYAFYITIFTSTKYNSQYKFDSEYSKKSKMIFWGVALFGKELVLYFCHFYISNQYPDPNIMIAAETAGVVLICTFVVFHVLLSVSVRLQWKMFRGKIVVTYMDKFMFSQTILLAIFKIVLILVVYLAILCGSDIEGLIQCYYTADILVVATVVLLSEMLSAESGKRAEYVDPDGGVEESKI